MRRATTDGNCGQCLGRCAGVDRRKDDQGTDGVGRTASRRGALFEAAPEFGHLDFELSYLDGVIADVARLLLLLGQNTVELSEKPIIYQ